MYKHDWYMNQIEQWVQFVAKVILKKDANKIMSSEYLELINDSVKTSRRAGDGNRDGDGGVYADGNRDEKSAIAERTAPLRRELARLIDEGLLNDAESLLFENLAEGDHDALSVALAFYWKLNSLDEHVLVSCAFPREEIEKGLRDALAAYGVVDVGF